MLWVRRAILAGVIVGLGSVAAAQDQMTAGSLSKNMTKQEQLAFMAGIVEGLASARFYADGKQSDGSACIFDWYYKTEGTFEKIIAAFDRFPSSAPGQVMAVLVRSKCGGGGK